MILATGWSALLAAASADTAPPADDRLYAPHPLSGLWLAIGHVVAVAELLRLAAVDRGVVLVFDDFHEADDASSRLVHCATHRLHDSVFP